MLKWLSFANWRFLSNPNGQSGIDQYGMGLFVDYNSVGRGGGGVLIAYTLQSIHSIRDLIDVPDYTNGRESESHTGAAEILQKRETLVFQVDQGCLS